MVYLWLFLTLSLISFVFGLGSPRNGLPILLEKKYSWLRISEAPTLLRSEEVDDAHFLYRPPMRLRSYQSHVARARDPRLFKEAAIRSAERSESMTIDRIDVGVLKPDETDRETLLGLAYASWDAYHPFPTNDTKWYTLDGFDWNAPFGWEPEEDGLRGHLFMSPDNSTALVTFKGTTVSGNGLQDSLASSSKKDKYNDNLLCSCCCADVLFARMDHPCHCSLGGNRCSNVCLTASLLSEHSYYAQATVVMSKFVAMYPDTTNWWATGHSLGGGLASLVGQTFGFPTVTFESIPERLAAERLHLVTSNTMSHEVPVVHVYNDADPIAMGTCNGPWSFCTRAGFAFESKCRTGKSIVYNTSSTSARDKLVRLNDTLAMTLKGRPNPVAAHRLAYILSVLQDETREVPVARVQGECQDCGWWSFGGFPGQADRGEAQEFRTWWTIWKSNIVDVLNDFIWG